MQYYALTKNLLVGQIYEQMTSQNITLSPLTFATPSSLDKEDATLVFLGNAT